MDRSDAFSLVAAWGSQSGLDEECTARHSDGIDTSSERLDRAQKWVQQNVGLQQNGRAKVPSSSTAATSMDHKQSRSAAVSTAVATNNARTVWWESTQEARHLEPSRPAPAITRPYRSGSDRARPLSAQLATSSLAPRSSGLGRDLQRASGYRSNDIDRRIEADAQRLLSERKRQKKHRHLDELRELRKRCLAAEERAMRAERQLSLPATCFAEVSPRGLVVEWSDGLAELTQVPKSTAVGSQFVDLVDDVSKPTAETLLRDALRGETASGLELVFESDGEHRTVLCSAGSDGVTVVISGADITELRNESKLLENYVKICGAAVWSMPRNDRCYVKEVERLIAQEAGMDPFAPRMVLWRATFISILKTTIVAYLARQKGEESNPSASPPDGPRYPKRPAQPPLNFLYEERQKQLAEMRAFYARGPEQQSPAEDEAEQQVDAPAPSMDDATANPPSFEFEFPFEASNGQVRWYRVEGHIKPTGSAEGSVQDVTSTLIDKVVGDRWQKWWSKMCLMVFDATLLVDTQEYRVLNAWGEESLFGFKLSPYHPILDLVHPDDVVQLKTAFNEVTFKGFEKGQLLRLRKPNNIPTSSAAASSTSPLWAQGMTSEFLAKCFLLSADQENPNECMVGIRRNEAGDERLWDVARAPVLTLEDLARFAPRRTSRKHRVRRKPSMHYTQYVERNVRSLSSIPEDFTEDVNETALTEPAQQEDEDSMGTKQGSGESEINSDSVCAGSASSAKRLELEAHFLPHRPPFVTVKWAKRKGEIQVRLSEHDSLEDFRLKLEVETRVPPARQTLVLGGKQLRSDQAFDTAVRSMRPGQYILLIGAAADGVVSAVA